MTLKDIYIASFSFAIIALSISCGISKTQERSPEPVPADQFFMLVLEIVETSGQLQFTPIFEERKEGKLKAFGPGPEGDSDGFWRVDHLNFDGRVVSSQWIKDPMQAEYEYSEDGTTLEKISFRLKNTAMALRIPIRVHGVSNEVTAVKIYQLVNAINEDTLLYTYNIK